MLKHGSQNAASFCNTLEQLCPFLRATETGKAHQIMTQLQICVVFAFLMNHFFSPPPFFFWKFKSKYYQVLDMCMSSELNAVV